MLGRIASARSPLRVLTIRSYRLSFPLFTVALTVYAACGFFLYGSGVEAIEQLCSALFLSGAGILLALDRPDARRCALVSTFALIALVVIRITEPFNDWLPYDAHIFTVLILVLAPVPLGLRALFLASWGRTDRFVAWLTLAIVGGVVALTALSGTGIFSALADFGDFWPTNRG